MTKPQAAEFLGCSIRQLERYTSENRIAVRYEKGRTRPTPVYDEDELHRFKTQQEQVLHKLAREITTQSDSSDTNALVHHTQPMSQLSQTVSSNLIEAFAHFIETTSVPTDKAKTPRRIDPREANVKLLLTLPEAQALTGLSRSTLRAAIDAGELEARQMGRAWRIKREALAEWIQGL